MANKLVTSNFKLNNIKQFIESIAEPANTIYYVFAGKPTPYANNDSIIETPVETVEQVNTKLYDEMVFAKQVTSADVKPMANRYDWTSGTTYDIYDDKDTTIQSKKYFVVSPEGSSYYVFKCLSNNNDSPSTQQPLFSATSSSDPYYETADGYVWKYLYSINQTTFTKFSTSKYIPVIPDLDVSSNAVSGSIDIIAVDGGGKYYNNYLSGSFTVNDTKVDGVQTKYRITADNASLETDFYKGCYIKITNGDSEKVGQYRKILSYSASGGKYIYVDSAFSVVPTDCEYQITPGVEITGDGRQLINAEARALVNSVSNTIYKIDVLNRGKGYFIASANVAADSSVRLSSSFNDADLRVVLPPKGGHGYDVESELYVTTMGISVKFQNTENGVISSNNDFRTIGIIKDPLFDDVKLGFDVIDLNGQFTDDESVAQLTLKRLGGGVGISTTSKQITGLGTLTGVILNNPGNITYAATDIIHITNVATQAICNATVNATGYMQSVAVVSPGFGFSDPVSPVIYVANTAEGNIRYANTKIVNSVSLSANGLSYSNSDYIIISGNSVTINAYANITTNSIGGITSLLFTNRGKGLNGNEIAYINILSGGSGYDSAVSNSIAFIGGDGTYAVATYTNSAVGVITSINLVNRGIGYTYIPTANALGGNSTHVDATFNIGIRSKDLSVIVANSTGGYSNGGKVVAANVISSGNSGLYSNSDIITFPSLVAAQGNAIANAVTNVDGSLLSVNAISGGNYGFRINNDLANTYIANSTGGNLRYFNSNIVSTIAVSNSSPWYKVSSVTITANGVNYNSTKVLRVDVVDGGIGYNSTTNNLIIFTGGGGSGANATFVNNSLGKITSITMVANGSGYSPAVAAAPASLAGGIGANLSVVLANSLTFSSTSGYGAVARFTNNALGNAVSVTVVNAGFGYTTAPTASIQDPTGTGATFTVVIDGGANNYSTGDYIVVSNGQVNASATITANSTNYINSVALTNSGKGFNYNSLVVSTTNSTSGNVRFFNNTIIKEITVNTAGYSDFASNNDILTITNGAINTTANIQTLVTGQLNAVSVATSGKGFANHSSLVIQISNSASGNVRYLNTNVVSAFTITDGGTGYSNTDYLVVSGTGAVTATANVVTSLSGTITDLLFNNRGGKLIPYYVSNITIQTGGSGYSNTDVITFCGGGGTGATGVLQTNSIGGVTKAYITNGGSNYECVPSVVIANSTGGTTTGINANLTPTVTKPYTIRIYNQSGNITSGNFADIAVTISASPTVTANLIYAPTQTISTASAANLSLSIVDSANMFFVAQQAVNLSLNITGQSTTFDSSIGSGDYIYIESSTGDSNLLQVDTVANSTSLTVTEYPTFSTTAAEISVANVIATGTVIDQSTGVVEVTDVRGFFTTENTIYGLSSKASTNVNIITLNNIERTSFTAVNQLFFYRTSPGSQIGSFAEDEIIYSANSITANSTARFHSSNSSGIFVTSPNGIFYPGYTITNQYSNASCVLSGSSSYKYEGDFKRGSGEIIYIENLDPITRSATQTETIKLIVEF